MPNQKPKFWENQDTVRVSLMVHKHIHTKIKSRLHHGQLTQLLRNVLDSVAKKISKEETIDVVNFIYKDKPLTLDPIKEKKK